MRTDDYNSKELQAFHDSVAPCLNGYGHAIFYYLAIKENGLFRLARGRMYLRGLPSTIAVESYESATVKAGCFRLNDCKLRPKEFLNQIVSGSLKTPHGDLHFQPDEGASHSVHFDPFYSENIQSQVRQRYVLINGGRLPIFNSRGLDWELRSAKQPFDGLQDLCTEFNIGVLNGSQSSIEIIAQNLAEIDVQSAINGNDAILILLLADGLDHEKSSIGYRLFEKGRIVRRESIAGSDLLWTFSDGLHRGKIQINVPTGAVLHCMANYCDEAHHHFWVVDPSTFQNPRRAVHHAFDGNLEILQELLKITGKGRDARDFESAIAWLLWMLGFSVAHLGGTPKTTDAMDLVATTPKGHFLVIECTTGILKSESKLGNLVDRAERVRKSLVSSGNKHLKVLAIIVTNKSREEVKIDAEQAEKDGIFVVTRDDFSNLLNFTLVQMDADTFFRQAEERLNQIRSNHSSLS